MAWSRKRPARRLAPFAQFMALNRMGRPEEAARAVALLSPAAGFITGANLVH